MHACTSFALRGNGHVIHSDNNKSCEGVNLAESICDVMTSNPRSLESGSSAVDAARLMRDEDVGIVPIVEGKKLVGIVAQKDVAMHASEAQTGEVVEDISR
jgi:CBS domain-containing protein